MASRDDRFSFDALAEIVQRVMAADGSDTLSDVLDEEMRWRLEDALDLGSRSLGRRPEFGHYLKRLRGTDSGRVPKPRRLPKAVPRPTGPA